MKKIQLLASILVVVLTFGFFGYYLIQHPSLFNKFSQLSIWQLMALFLLYGGFTLALSVVLRISVAMCGFKIDRKKSLTVTAASSLANFFGPLQSGPGVRAIYLKKKYGIPIKRYGLVTLYYYGFYAVFSGIFLLSSDAAWRLPLIGLLLLGSAITIWYLRRQTQKNTDKNNQPQFMNFVKLGLATLSQLLCIVGLYFVQLTSLNPQISLSQVISYTGAANFSLFVAFTPGAIGIREAFLVFANQLHHISSSTIIAANIIDRSVYVLFLGCLFIYLVVNHAQSTLDGLHLASKRKQTPRVRND